MINFRFHIVSLTAVFLALAIGIVMGVSVIDQATVEQLEEGIKRAEEGAEEVRGENSDLRGQLGRWSDFAEQAGDELVEGRLNDVAVVIVTFDGTDDEVLSALRGSIAASGATLGGVVRFTERMALEDAADAQALAAAVAVGGTAADTVRQAAIEQLAAEFAVGASPLLAALETSGFIDLDGPVDPATVVSPASRFVLLSDQRATPPNAVVAVPFTVALARQAAARVVAAEPSVTDDADDERPQAERERIRFVRAVRDAPDIRLSTVDNAADFRGRVATVLAVAALASGQVGDYGVGPGADRLVPELEP